MAYTDVPMANQSFQITQPLIEQNFIEINNLVSVDHYTFGSPDQGQHMKVTLPDQGISPMFPAGDVGLYAQTPTVPPLTTFNELFVRKQDNTRIPITAGSLNQTTGWCYLPSGILLKWGKANSTGLSNPFVFPTAGNIPAFNGITPNNPFSIQLTPISATRTLIQVITGTVSNLGFNISTSDSNNIPVASDFYYLAIGL